MVALTLLLFMLLQLFSPVQPLPGEERQSASDHFVGVAFGLLVCRGWTGLQLLLSLQL